MTHTCKAKNADGKVCGHTWSPRVKGRKPLCCPRCKRYDWDK